MVAMVAFLPSHASDARDAAATRVAPRNRIRDTEAYRPAALAEFAPTPAPSSAAAGIGVTRRSWQAFVRPETRPHPDADARLDEPTRPTASASGAVWRPGGALVAAHPHEARALADSADRDAWLRARTGGITATDAAKLATPNSIRQVVRDKLEPSGFAGNAYTEHGRQREPEIAAWVLDRHGIASCGMLYHAERSRRHLATPDGLHADDGGRVLLAEIKTTGKAWNRIPRSYLRQVYWQQYVLGAERTLFVWEEHRDFVVQHPEPKCVWIERDDAEIDRLVTLADLVLAELDRVGNEIERHSLPW